MEIFQRKKYLRPSKCIMLYSLKQSIIEHLNTLCMVYHKTNHWVIVCFKRFINFTPYVFFPQTYWFRHYDDEHICFGLLCWLNQWIHNPKSTTSEWCACAANTTTAIYSKSVQSKYWFWFKPTNAVLFQWYWINQSESKSSRSTSIKLQPTSIKFQPTVIKFQPATI